MPVMVDSQQADHINALIAYLTTELSALNDGRYQKIEWNSQWRSTDGARTAPALYVAPAGQFNRPGPWSNTNELVVRVKVWSVDLSSDPTNLEATTGDQSLIERAEELRATLYADKQFASSVGVTYGIEAFDMTYGMQQISGDLAGVVVAELEMTRYEVWSGRSNADATVAIT